jgi:hypothetical protein
MQNKLVIILSIFLFSVSTAFSQKMVNSPFARFNLGLLSPAGSFKSQGMGGISVAQRDNTSIYFTNPASYSSLDTNSFVFDFGIDYSMNKLTDKGSKYTSDDMNFDHLILGFPIAKGFGVATGIIPYSNGYYRIQNQITSTDPQYDHIIGAYTASHGGEGGYTQFFLGSGLKLNKYVSAGINMTILFGQVRRTNQFNFSDIYNAYHNNSSENLQLGGINFDYGLQFTAPLKKNYFLNAGLSLTSGKHYNTDYQNFVFRYTSFGSTDTISYTSDKTHKAFIPATIRAGLSFGKKNKFTAGLDFISSKWSASVIPGSAGYAADTKEVRFGLEYIPDITSNYNYLKRINYRLGAHTGTNYLVIDGNQLKETGISFGAGIPLGRTYSKVNWFIDFSKRSDGSNLMKENYITTGLSLNLWDFWFMKKKFE